MIPQIIGVDATNLNRAIKLATEWGTRSAEQAVIMPAYNIMLGLSRNTPKSSMQKIDEGLAVDVIPVIGKRGKPLSQKYAKNRLYRGNASNSYKPPIPFAWLLISARANPGSKYNRLTGGRYQIAGGHPLKGKPVSQFDSIIQGFTTRMVKARHSSIAFLASATVPVIQWLYANIDAKYRRGGKVDPEALSASRHSRAPKGIVTLTGQGTTRTSLTVDLMIGMHGGPLAEKQNEAMHRIMGPVLQSELDKEAYAQTAYVAPKMALAGKTPQFAALGVVVTP